MPLSGDGERPFRRKKGRAENITFSTRPWFFWDSDYFSRSFIPSSKIASTSW